MIAWRLRLWALLTSWYVMFFYETRTTCTWELCNTCFLSLLSAGHKETRGSCYCPTQCNLTSFATTPSVASLSSFGVSELLDRNDKHVEDRLVTKCDFRRSAREGVPFLEIFTVAPWYKVHKDHHVMICIGNRVNLHLFLTILIMFLDEEIMILSNIFGLYWI